MRIAGYVREVPGHEQADTAFAQSERIRRWAKDSGNELIATCQDHRTATFTDRPGFAALTEIVRSGSADAVVVATLDAVSSDKVLQEIALVDLRSAGVTVVSTDDGDFERLGSDATDHTRMVVRDVVAKVAEYREAYGLSGEPGGVVAPDPAHTTIERATPDVVVELIAPTG